MPVYIGTCFNFDIFTKSKFTHRLNDIDNLLCLVINNNIWLNV